MSFVDLEPPSANVKAVGDGLALFLDKQTLAQKLKADVAFGGRFYLALATFLAGRLRDSVRRMGYHRATTLDAQAIEMDEQGADVEVDAVARERFERMLRLLAGQR